MPRVLRKGPVIVVIVILTHASAWAQATAQMSGTVRDESGGVLPGVTVTATQTDTGFSRTVVTETSGSYVLTNLPTGPYRLEASLQGCRTFVQTGIVLQVGGSPVINVVLGVGTLEESVTVQSAAPLVDVQSAGIREVVENQRIVELPLQGRQVTDLIVLAGAAVNTADVSGQRQRSDAVAISVAGGLRAGVTYVLDGAMHNDPYDNLNLPFPFPDAMQEFSVATSGLSADNGMHSAAAVNAVTKSGTNRFSGNAFEFLRDHRFNAPAYFAPVGPDGKRVDDGLRRNQFGGTFGGPIVRNKLFFFGGHQSTVTHQVPAAFIAYTPTAAMMAGDFTAFTSPACNVGRQITLRAPFVNNTINPALFSPPAVQITRSLPVGSDPCGQVKYSVPLDNNDYQDVARVDFQLNANHTIFGRYINSWEHRLQTLSRTGNILTVNRDYGANKRARAHSFAFGDTRVFGSQTVNAFRVTFNKTSNHLNDPPDPFFDGPSLGIKMYTYVPGVIGLNVTNGFIVSGGNAVKFSLASKSYQVANDLSVVRGKHQMSFGGNVSYWKFLTVDNARSAGQFNFSGANTGLGLADFLTGQSTEFLDSAPGVLNMKEWYLGLYAQDTWRTTDRLTLNAGLRWEPFFGQNMNNGAIANFSLANFQQGIKTTKYVNAPPGLTYPGDPGFPPGNSGMNTQWRNFSPRVGLAWDVNGNGRTAVRSSYGISYDFPTAQYLYVEASASPFSNRLDITGNIPFEDPYRNVPGGNTLPLPVVPPRDAAFPGLGTYGAMDPNINSPRVQSWNATLERQIGQQWQVAASYLGSYADRLWGQNHLNPGVFLGTAPCALGGVSYPVCTTTSNVESRRVFILQNPAVGQYYGAVVQYTDVGTQSYRGLKLSVRRRSADGVSLNANYTLSHCTTDTEVSGGFAQFTSGYTNPSSVAYDRGNCGSNRRQIATATVGVRTPAFANAALRTVASDWRLSGILNARSGSWLTITTTADPAGVGVSGQRPNQVLDNPYGDKSLDNWLNVKAFAAPTPGTFGNTMRNSVEGPGYWSVDLALSRLVARDALELRLEVFNLLNNFNWGNPSTSINSSTFGRIQTQIGDSRIMQFGIKYGF